MTGAGDEGPAAYRYRCSPPRLAPIDAIPDHVRHLELVARDGVHPATAHDGTGGRGESLGLRHPAEIPAVGIEQVPRIPLFLAELRRHPEVASGVGEEVAERRLGIGNARRVYLAPLLREPFEPLDRFVPLRR